MNKFDSLRIFFEQNGFEVCSKLADMLGIRAKNVRLFFVYASFTTIIGGFFLFISLFYYSLIMRWNKRYIGLN